MYHVNVPRSYFNTTVIESIVLLSDSNAANNTFYNNIHDLFGIIIVNACMNIVLYINCKG